MPPPLTKDVPMRATEDQIKSVILHPDEEIRLEAVGYWSDAFCPDPTVMPLVIQAVERYGRESAFRIMRDAEHLEQTPETLDWLMDELRRDYDPEDIPQDNYRFAVGLALVAADPELLLSRHKQILQLPAFPKQLRKPLDDRLRFHLTDWPDLWKEMEDWADRWMGDEERISLVDSHHLSRLLKAMGRHADQADKVLAALDGKVAPTKRERVGWLLPDLIFLAGHMRLKQAIPRIMRRIAEGQEVVLDVCGYALGRIGTDVVVDEIVSQWGRSDSDRRLTLAEALGKIHTDLCIRRCVQLADDVDAFDVALFLANALCSHLCTEGVELARDLALEDAEGCERDQRDLRFRAVAVATILGIGFDEYEQWEQEYRQESAGWGQLERERISRNF